MSKTLHIQAAEMVLYLSDLELTPPADDPVWNEIHTLAAKLRKKDPPPTEEEMKRIDDFRLSYKKLRGSGAIPGLSEVTKVLVRHKDWREVLRDIDHNIGRQIEERKARAEANEFVPQWPMLTTYINQRRWEMIYFDLSHRSLPNDGIPDQYAEWLRRFTSKHLSYEEIRKRCLSKEQYHALTNCQGEHVDLPTYFSAETRKRMIADCHSDYYRDGRLLARFVTVHDYIKHIIAERKKQLT